MDWINSAIGRVVVQSDWARSRFLDHIDPYLVWADVTHFAGVSLPSDNTLPMIEERGGVDRQYGTKACQLKELHQYLADGFDKSAEVNRFEIAPGIVNDDIDPEPRARRDLQKADAELLRSSTRRTVVGFIDYGCAFAHRNFRRDDHDGDTRVLALWDQSGAVPPAKLPQGRRRLQWRVPPDLSYGTETHRDQIWDKGKGDLPLGQYIRQFKTNGVLDEEACYRHSGYQPIMDSHASHGTHIMDVATGWPSPLQGLLPATQKPSAPHDADIVFVQLPRHVAGRQVGGLLRANVYDALRYIALCAAPDADVVVNLSYGGYAGPHDGSSILERAMDAFLLKQNERRTFRLVIPAGNARDSNLHVRAILDTSESAIFRWNNLPDDPSDSFVEIWMPEREGFEVTITAPGGTTVSTGMLQAGSVSSLMPETADPTAQLPLASLIYPRRVCQTDGRGTMALLAVGPTRLGMQYVAVPQGGPRMRRPAAPYGEWTIEVKNVSAKPGTVHAWCELDRPAFGTAGQPRQAYFADGPYVDMSGTLNSIAHGKRPIVVGGYAIGGRVARYSGTGAGRGTRPGPDVMGPSDEADSIPGIAAAAAIGTDTLRLNGTSVAAAAVTRSILECQFEWPGPPGDRPAAVATAWHHPTDLDRHPDEHMPRLPP